MEEGGTTRTRSRAMREYCIHVRAAGTGTVRPRHNPIGRGEHPSRPLSWGISRAAPREKELSVRGVMCARTVHATHASHVLVVVVVSSPSSCSSSSSSRLSLLLSLSLSLSHRCGITHLRDALGERDNVRRLGRAATAAEQIPEEANRERGDAKCGALDGREVQRLAAARHLRLQLLGLLLLRALFLKARLGLHRRLGHLLRTRKELAHAAIVLKVVVLGDLAAVRPRQRHPAVRLPRRLLLVVLELDVETRIVEQLDERLDAGRVVVPPASVHVGAVGERQGRCVRLVTLEEIVQHGVVLARTHRDAARKRRRSRAP